MDRRDFYYPSADGITQIHAIEWTPQNVRHFKGIIQISHGLGEYTEMYKPIAEFFTGRGFIVRGIDLIGHGDSVAEGQPRMYFGGNGSWRFAVDDIYHCRKLTVKEYGDLPYIMLGFSTGSYLMREYLIRYKETVDAAILMGCGMYSKAEMIVAKSFAKLEILLHGRKKKTKAISIFLNGINNLQLKYKPTSLEWLNKNPKAQIELQNYPYGDFNPTSGLFLELMKGIDYTGRVKNIMKMDTGIPVFFLSGDEDPTAGKGKTIRRIRDLFIKAGVKDTRMTFYPGRHRILFEECADRVVKDIFDWACSKLKTEDVDLMEKLNPMLLTAQKSLYKLARGGIKEANILCDNIIDSTGSSADTERYKEVDRIIEILSKGSDNCTLLDIGCGFAPRAIKYHNSNVRYLGVDLPSVIIEAEAIFSSSVPDIKPELSVADATSYHSLHRLIGKAKGDIILLTENLEESLLEIEKGTVEKNLTGLMNELGAYWIRSNEDGIIVKASDSMDCKFEGETDFYLSHEVTGKEVIIKVSGVLNAITAPRFLSYCEGLKNELSGRSLVLDLNDVTEKTSMGAKALQILEGKYNKND